MLAEAGDNPYDVVLMDIQVIKLIILTCVNVNY